VLGRGGACVRQRTPSPPQTLLVRPLTCARLCAAAVRARAA
jgi:hypothetical protein